MEEKKYLTQEGLDKLKEELFYLKNTKRKEIAQKLKKAISFGDLSENAAYSEAKDDQAFLEGRILELKNIIASARLINNEKSEKVRIGSRVTIKLSNEEKELEFLVVDESEAEPSKMKISFKSPLGAALLGQKEGEEIKIDINGEKIKYVIVKID